MRAWVCVFFRHDICILIDIFRRIHGTLASRPLKGAAAAACAPPCGNVFQCDAAGIARLECNWPISTCSEAVIPLTPLVIGPCIELSHSSRAAWSLGTWLSTAASPASWGAVSLLLLSRLGLCFFRRDICILMQLQYQLIYIFGVRRSD